MIKKTNDLFPFASLLLVGLVLAVVLTACRAEPEFKGSLIDPPMPAADFRLTNDASETASLADYRGNYVLLFFGYTNCPDVCPATMSVLAKVYNQLKTAEQADQVQVILVTTDPKNDTPQAMADFLGHFDPDFTGMTGSKEQLQLVWKDYGVMVMDDGMTHSARVYLIDPQGNIRLTYPSAGLADDIVSDLQLLFAEN